MPARGCGGGPGSGPAPLEERRCRSGRPRAPAQHPPQSRYSEEHGGVVLGYRHVRVRGRRAALLPGLSAHLRLSVSCQLLLFSPRPGDMLRGTVNCVGADFVGLLVLGLFNVTVSDQHLLDFKFLRAKSVWKHRTNGKHRIQLGSEVQAQVVSVQDSGHMVDIRASLNTPSTGCIEWLQKGTA